MKKIINDFIDRTLFISLCSLLFILFLLIAAIAGGYVADAKTAVMRISGFEMLLCLVILPAITASIWMLVDKLNRTV
jgi:hypothetical protein